MQTKFVVTQYFRTALNHRLRRAAIASLAAAWLAGCAVFSPPTQVRGNIVDLDELKELTPGISMRADVRSLLGSPTARATFDDNRWIYIGEVTDKPVGRIQNEVSQEVVVIAFDDKGVLRSIKTLDKGASIPVAMANGETPTPGAHASFLKQVLGNIGGYNPGIGAGMPGTANAMPGATIP
jgi:outer membrane protein assembly factor BamE (lipoprotein component of BamABCDE complex)